MNLKKLKYIFLFLAFQAGFFILFSQTSLAADVFTLTKTLEVPDAGALYFSPGRCCGVFTLDG